MRASFAAGRPASIAGVLTVLPLTQLIGWGTTYYLPALLAAQMSAATGVPHDLVFGGITIMSLMSAALAPWLGRRLQGRGAGPWMALGSVLMAAGLVILAGARSPLGFVLSWTVMGIAAPMALNQGASTAIVQAARPDGARRGLTILLLFTGLASTASWPVLIWLDGWIGWRASLLVYATVHLLVCAPLHLFLLPRGKVGPDGGRPALPGNAGADSQPDPIPGSFRLAAIAFSMAGFISYGMPLHVISLLEDYGHSRAEAVVIGTLLGPGQLLARLVDMFGGHRVDILTVGLAAALLTPVSLLLIWLDGDARWAAITFTLAYGIGAGLMSIVRAVAPLRLFGRAAYASELGRLSVPLNLAFAFSPLVLATVRGWAGSGGLLAVVMAAALTALAAMAVLWRRAFPARRV